jgi:hypothetical protein
MHLYLIHIIVDYVVMQVKKIYINMVKVRLTWVVIFLLWLPSFYVVILNKIDLSIDVEIETTPKSRWCKQDRYI